MRRSVVTNQNNSFSNNASSGLNDPNTVFDLSKSVRKFLQRILTINANTVNDNDGSIKDDNFYEIVRISVESHNYHKQWQTSSWTIEDIQNVVEVINRFELNALALHGKVVWLLLMMLKHNQQSIPIKQNEVLSKSMVGILFELIFTQTVYNKSIAILRLLHSSYGFSFTELFMIGAQMKDKYPDMIEDHNFIALMQFSDEAVKQESQSIHFSVEILLTLSSCLCGDLEKSNFFLMRTLSFFSAGLQMGGDADNSKNPISAMIEIQNGVTVNVYKTFGNTVVLLRTLATFQPQNRDYLGKNQMILDIVLRFLLNGYQDKNEWYESIAREILCYLNVLSSGMALNKITLMKRLPLSSLMEVASNECIGINDTLIDLYMTLYEDTLSYCDDELRYMISDDRDHQSFIQKVLQPMVKKLFELIALLPSASSSASSSSAPSSSSTIPNPDTTATTKSTSDIMIEITFIINVLYRVLFKLEVSLRIASDMTSFLPLKQDILTIFHELLGTNPRKWNLRYIKLTDILVLLHCGADNCWDVPALHAVDQGFVNISHQLVAQFVSLTNDKIFDAKDRNTLNYLAGSDENSTIQSIISKNCDDEHNKSFEMSSPNISSTLESSGSMSRSPRQLGLLLSAAANGSHGNLQQFAQTMTPSTTTTTATSNMMSPGPTIGGDGENNNAPVSSSPKIRPNSNFASGRFNVSHQEIHSYLNTFRNLLISLSGHMNFITHMVSDWMLEEALLNYKRLAYLYVVTKLFGLYQVNQVIQQSQHMIELLWKNVLGNENSCSSMMADEKFYLFDMHKRCVQVITLFLQVNGSDVPPAAAASSAKGASAGQTESGRDAPSSTGGNSVFSGAVAYGEWLTKTLEQRPGYLLKASKKKAQELIAARKLDVDKKKEKGGAGKGSNAVTEENGVSRSDGTITGEGISDDRDGRDNELDNDDDDADTGDDMMSRSGGDRMSLMGNIVIRPSAFLGNGTGDDENAGMHAYNAEDFLVSSMTGGGDEQSLFQLPPTMNTWMEHDLNLDFHCTCVDGLLTLSIVDRTVRRKLVPSCSSLIYALYFLSPMDAINGKPMLHLVKSMVEFVPKLELGAEESIVGLIIRNITSPLFNIRTQVCDLIYSIGQESPGFIFRGISRREIEDPLIQIFVHQQEHYELIRNTKKEKEKANQQQQQQQQLDQESSSNKGSSSLGNQKESFLLVNDEIKPYAILLLNALKACTVIVHNFNVKPVWLPSPWLYHWQYYQPIISTRDIMTAKGLAIIISVLKHAAIPYRLPYFMYTLSLTSSIMYAFSDGMINPTDKQDILQMKLLKDLLVENTLPWLPIAIDFIILGKRKKGRSRSITAAKSNGDGATDGATGAAVMEGSNKGSESQRASSSKKENQEKDKEKEKKTPKRGSIAGKIVAIAHAIPGVPAPSSSTASTASQPAAPTPAPVAVVPVAQVTTVVLNCRKPVPPASTFVKIDFSDQVKSILVETPQVENYLTSSSAGSEEAKLQKAVRALTLAKANSASKVDNASSSVSASEQEVYENMYKIKAIEMLTERTMEAIYAFLCTDDMFPLSTYLQYIHLFQSNSLIASVSYFMTEFKANPIILRRGLDFMKYFSDYQMNLSSMAMHAPPALLNAFTFHKDVLDVQTSFVRVIFVICRTHDDFAKDNVTRFNIHLHLVDLLNQLSSNQSQGDLCRMIIQTVLELIFNESHVLTLTNPNEVTKYVDSLVNVINVMVKDVKVQYEAVRALAALDHYTPEFVSESPKRQVIFTALKKARKLLVQEQSKFPDNGEDESEASDPPVIHMTNPIAAADSSKVTTAANHTAQNGIPAVSSNVNGDITKQELDVLLNGKIWAKEKCTIC